jgi:3-isopropylmalate/(R)-2-methylmalate dehydratase small subunit
MQPFTTHTGIAAPLLRDDINTDQVAPIQAFRALKPNYKALLFARAKLRDDGSEDPDFVLNKPQFRNPSRPPGVSRRTVHQLPASSTALY